MSLKPILLADDDSNDIFIFWHFHQLCGVLNPIEMFSDGEDVIAYFRKSPPAPALMFLDFKMPRVGALQVLEHLALWPGQEFPKIVLSGNEDPKLIERACQLGAQAVLPKPLEKKTFCELMAKTEGISMKGCGEESVSQGSAAKSSQPAAAALFHALLQPWQMPSIPSRFLYQPLR